MTTMIHPAALKYYRDEKRWTQEQLADATKGKNRVSLPTIKRIERTKSAFHRAEDRVAEGLAKALGVTADALSKPPNNQAEREASLKQFGYRPLRTMVDAETALAFNMVQQIYGIPVHSQIVMAPLFAALLAEGSLSWRRERVAEIEEAADRLMSLGGGHFAFANSAYLAQEGADQERRCIEKRDLFGRDIPDGVYDFGYDPSRNNPFADFLKHFASKVGAETVSFDGLWSTSSWKTSEGMPEYRIGSEMISDLTGDDPDAEYALLRGYAKVKDIPTDLLGEDHLDDRISWIVGRIPEAELEKRRSERAARLSLTDDLDLDSLLAMLGTDDAKENDDE
ncbi:helix-turn-helix domain-containing protein [Phaeovulum vinaykumarii]|uniref:Helix-turn-helix n=1 Tax=Phaeovulum vinaykumarii TaxID=407234 RepID=A0A1N7N1E8_9RHOB|nr:helix-turn-helix transcriptional regulator [Phaeovulum vinaykumarii]SIS92162.1 Helix-turn-helix [Phaeovulum vinaykumarii]SOC17963.1 helix-turn-helix protein [Phaeovulum vinaykumarii]